MLLHILTLFLHKKIYNVRGQYNNNIIKCCRVFWNSDACNVIHRRSTNFIIVIYTWYKYYVLEEDSNAIVLASYPVRWNGITHRKLKLYINFVSLGRYCIYQHCFYTEKYYVHGQHNNDIVLTSFRVRWNGIT
jgi:hypothetical protein